MTEITFKEIDKMIVFLVLLAHIPKLISTI